VSAHTLINEGGRRATVRRRGRNGLLQLGWWHFWFLISILGGMLALAAMVFFIDFLR